MGQKRTQNIIDEKIGTYLANFEQDVLAKIDRQLTARLDTLQETETAFKKSVAQASRSADNARHAVERFSFRVTLNYGVAGLLGGAIGGLLMYLFLVLI